MNTPRNFETFKSVKSSFFTSFNNGMRHKGRKAADMINYFRNPMPNTQKRIIKE